VLERPCLRHAGRREGATVNIFARDNIRPMSCVSSGRRDWRSEAWNRTGGRGHSAIRAP
jgi:hypothetical protein